MLRHRSIRVNNFVLRLTLPPPPIDPRRFTYQQPMDKNVIEYLGEERFLHINDSVCDRCNKRMKWEHDNRRFDKYQLRCGICRGSRSIRHGTFFAHHPHISIPTLFQIIRNLYEGREQKFISEETNVSDRTIVEIHKEYGEMVRQYNDNHPVHFFADDIVEIDEKKLKWHIGLRDPDPNAMVVEGDWVIGLAARESEKVYMAPIVDRSHASVLPIIMNRIDEGAIVITDKLGFRKGQKKDLLRD